MMKNILVLTTIYDSPDIKIPNTTRVVLYFAEEWVKMGYNVRVVFNYPIYLRVFHWIAGFLSGALASKFNTSVTATYTKKDFEYELNGVKSIRMPLFKPVPRGKVPHSRMVKQVDKIALYCKKENFVPDSIVAHNFYPHLEMVNLLKREHFNQAKTCVVVHKQKFDMLKFVPKWKQQVEFIDVWGFRSLPLKHDFENYAGGIKKNFLCCSGVSTDFLKNRIDRTFDKPVTKFIYTGSFIRRKHADKLLMALDKSGINDFSIDFVGDGIMRKHLEDYVKGKQWNNNVTFHGFVPRYTIPEMLERAECFCMISEEETFGLVYLEAMSKGCITIASKNEGMEGIIIDGDNGFMCEAGNSDELAQIISKIHQMPLEELNRIAKNAQDTAYSMSDKKVAEIYVKNII